ncbi:MAG: ankyrin repeat domain-containing protein [Planctomycetes bacterium]|nr:ankyrin repeat domain-containing protein [Planctomycetota bacterium]
MLRRLLIPLLITAAISTQASAHETDQFTIPVGRDFAELGPYFDELMHDTIQSAVIKINERIYKALLNGRSEKFIAKLQSHDEIAKATFNEFETAYMLIHNLERLTKNKKMKQKYPGQMIGYKTQFRNIYKKVHFPLDPRQLFRIWHASTLKVNGTYLGTDKIGHFTDMGFHYYKAYRKALRNGASKQEAIAKAVRVGTNGLLFGETGMVGYMSAGAYSNADLAANYSGFKFYINLSQEAKLKDEMRPPMLILKENYWHLNSHVRPNSGFFSIFISDHFNEALNPSKFEAGMRKAVRKAVKKRAAGILRWYADDNGAIRSRKYFDKLLQELTTLWGEDYGHRGTDNELITIGNTCYGSPMAQGDDGNSAIKAFYWAAYQDNTECVKQLLEEGMAVDQPLGQAIAGRGVVLETALHVAASAGNVHMVCLLLSRGAKVNAPDDQGATALHRAIEFPNVVDALIDYHADVNAKDARGRTPLHWLARYPNFRTFEKLIAKFADINAVDNLHETPLHRAAMWGQVAMVQMLLGHGANVNAIAKLQTTPLHFAVSRNQTAVAEILIASSASLGASDEFGWTALHDAARSGHYESVKLLVEAGASGNAGDRYGSTPIHEAMKAGHVSLAEYLRVPHTSMFTKDVRKPRKKNFINSIGVNLMMSAMFSSENIASQQMN